MNTQPSHHGPIACATVALTLAMSSGRGVAQSYPDWVTAYLSHGADVTSVPAPGRPGAAYFSNGADATSVHTAGKQDPAYFSQGADATSVHTAGKQDPAYFSNGADVTSVTQQGPVGAAYYSDGADATSVPAPGQPGAAFYSDGADVMSMPVTGQRSGLYFWQRSVSAVAAAAQASTLTDESNGEQSEDEQSTEDESADAAVPTSEAAQSIESTGPKPPPDQLAMSLLRYRPTITTPATVENTKDKAQEKKEEDVPEDEAPEIPLYDITNASFDLGMHIVLVSARIVLILFVLSLCSVVASTIWQVYKRFRERE